MTAAPLDTLTRVTLVAPHRRVDLVLPSEPPLGTLLPEIVRLLGYQPPASPRAYRMSLLDGRVLEPEHSLRSAQVLDGTLVRVDPISEAPMPAVVHDVTDAVADDLDRRGGRWGATPHRWVCTAVIVAAALWASLQAVPQVLATGLLSVGLVALAVGTALGLARAHVIGTSLLLAGAAVTAVGIPFLLADVPAQWAAWMALLGLTMAAAGAANDRRREGLTGAVALFGLLALWVVCGWTIRTPDQVATVLALASTLVLGILPRVALVSSGLTRLDDQQFNNRQASRTSVKAAVDSAHRGLALAVIVASASVALAAWTLSAASTNAWAVVLAGLVGVSTLLRVRAHPLTSEVVSLIAATGVALVGLVQHWMRSAPALWWAGVLVALAVIAVALLTESYRPPDRMRARARQVADRVEALAVVAMVPAAVGAFGVYERLLGTF